MKKSKLIILLIITAVVFVSGIAVMNTSSGGQDYMNAVVLDVGEEFVLVELLDTGDVNSSLRAADKETVLVRSDTVNKSAGPDLRRNDTIRVVYDAGSIDRDPLRIETVYAIYLLDEIKETE